MNCVKGERREGGKDTRVIRNGREGAMDENTKEIILRRISIRLFH
jgi:hypothetical protein